MKTYLPINLSRKKISIQQTVLLYSSIFLLIKKHNKLLSKNLFALNINYKEQLKIKPALKFSYCSALGN